MTRLPDEIDMVARYRDGFDGFRQSHPLRAWWLCARVGFRVHAQRARQSFRRWLWR